VKLYWRVKRNGKWTWRPAKFSRYVDSIDEVCCILIPGEEE